MAVTCIARCVRRRRLLQKSCSLRFVADHWNLTTIGPVGVEKTGWSQPVVHWFCEAGAHVRFGRPESLLPSLQQSQMDNSREELIPAQTTVDVLVLDDVMLKPAGRAEHRDDLPNRRREGWWLLDAFD